MSKQVHSLSEFQPDFRYVREGLRFAADLYRAGEFGEMADTLQELSGVCANLAVMARESETALIEREIFAADEGVLRH